MQKKLKKIIKQALSFFAVSGIGWIIDMVIYIIISKVLPVSLANTISSAISVTYVYIVSTKKIFENTKTMNLKQKYIIYIGYQIAMILLSATLIGFLSDKLVKTIYKIIIRNYKIVAKILVTPFTMIMNFIFMKFLMEKI